MTRPFSSTTSTPSSIALKSVSRKFRSRASRCTTVWSPCASSRPMRPSTRSKKLDLPGIPDQPCPERPLQPLFALEPPDRENGGNQRQHGGQEIALPPLQLRHVAEVH